MLLSADLEKYFQAHVPVKVKRKVDRLVYQSHSFKSVILLIS